MSSKGVQIAIDGPAASGKTTVARAVARALHALYLDTGAMYRAVAFLALQYGVDPADGPAVARLCREHPVRVELDADAPMGFRIFAGARELGDDVLHSLEVTAAVPAVAASPDVRAAMVEAQRRIAADGAVVMAGRDIGTVVLPDAAVKIFLTASVAARVERRVAQLEAAGVAVDRRALAADLEERDRIDRSRAASPLEPAPDARTIDSSELTAAQVVARIVDAARAIAPAS